MKNVLLSFFSAWCLLGCSITNTKNEFSSCQHINQNASLVGQLRLSDLITDDTLVGLVNSIESTSLDIAVARLKVEQAVLNERLVLHNQNVQFSSSIGYSGSQQFKTKDSSISNNYNASLSSSYSVDLWGKKNILRIKSNNDLYTEELTLKEARLQLITAVAKKYWNIILVNIQIEISKSKVELLEDKKNIIKVKYNNGVVVETMVTDAENALLNEKLNFEKLVVLNNSLLREMYVLSGGETYFDIELDNFNKVYMEKFNYDVIPMSKISYRYDVSEAEYQLCTALLDYEFSKLDFYPDISIGAALSSGSVNLSDIIREPVSSWGLDISLPFLNWQEKQIGLGINESKHKHAQINFKSTVLSALSDIKSKLDNVKLQQKKIRQEEKELELSARLLTQSKFKIEQGVIENSDLIDSKLSLLDHKESLASLTESYLVSELEFKLSIGI
ncbi:TolC family protein [Shewanella japonica]|uniref:TolC family protein n=1 Tax=Shewanella japonica TaxID=93973 RepID=UPI002493F5C1|nr:TolC family protein [Shewanella japonica]